MSGANNRVGGTVGGVPPAHWDQYALHVRNLSAEGNVAKLKEVMNEAQDRLSRALEPPGGGAAEGGEAAGMTSSTADAEWAKLTAIMDIQEHSLAMVAVSTTTSS